MRKLLSLILLVSSLSLVGSAEAAKPSGASLDNPQVRIQIGQGRRHYRDGRDWNRGYGRTFTRDVRYGRRFYR